MGSLALGRPQILEVGPMEELAQGPCVLASKGNLRKGIGGSPEGGYWDTDFILMQQ